MAPLLSSPRHGIWLVPTTEYKLASAARRDKPRVRSQTSDPERTRRNWLERDRLLDVHVRAQAGALGLTLFEVDGRLPPDDVAAQLEQHFELGAAARRKNR